MTMASSTDTTSYPGVSIETLEHTFSDLHPVYMKKFKPTASPPLAKLVFVHGYDDHIGRYYDFFPTLAQKGISVIAWDQRGWGASAKTAAQYGHTGTTEMVLNDIVHVIRSELSDMKIEDDTEAAPVFVMGHSMGGAQVLTLASDPKYLDLMPKVRGWLLESPHIALVPSAEPSALKIFAGRLAGRLLPTFKIKHKMPADQVTRDPEVQKSLNEDPLLRATGTLQGMSGLLDRAADLSAGKRKLNEGVKSLWLAHGTADLSVSYEASKKWFDTHCQNVPDATLKTYEGWSHQLHADMPDNRHIFANDVADWILARASGPLRREETKQGDVKPVAPVASEDGQTKEPIEMPKVADRADENASVKPVNAHKL